MKAVSKTKKAVTAQKRILLAEDDEFVCRAYAFSLDHAGYEVTAVRNGIDALDKIESEHFDLILLDLIMPQLNGFELLSILQKEGISKKVPVMVISNLGQKTEIEQCKKLGAVDFLIKSNFFMKEVLDRIEHTLSHFRASSI